MSRLRFTTRAGFALFALATSILHTPASRAGPISYEGGWIFSTRNQPDSINWQVSYSPKPWLSFGVDYAYDKMAGPDVAPKNYGLLRGNLLLKRWNEMESQGNIYLYGGAGGLKTSDATTLAWLGGIEADWETREIYTSVKAQYLDSETFDPSTMYQARFGVAPYLTTFENLHTWVILEVQYSPEAFDEQLKVSPVMRFYIDNVLWELGVSARGTWSFNTMVHF